jgi:hypothetical protein
METERILEAARRAKLAGSTRFCMGSAWREVGNKHAFKRVLEAVREIDAMGMEVCTTLGMLSKEQVLRGFVVVRYMFERLLGIWVCTTVALIAILVVWLLMSLLWMYHLCNIRDALQGTGRIFFVIFICGIIGQFLS